MGLLAKMPNTDTIAVRLDSGLYYGTLGQIAWVEQTYIAKELLAQEIAKYTEGAGVPEGISPTAWWERYPQSVLAVVLVDLLNPVQCAHCGDWGLEGNMHYPGGDPENGPRHARITQQELDRRTRQQQQAAGGR